MPNVLAAMFDQGQVPTITCVNKASVPLGVDFDKLISVMQEYVDKHFAPVWGITCKIVKSASGKIPKGNWAIVFIDNADVANALGYHDLTPDGLPLSKIFVKTTVDNGDLVSVTATHELAEMLVDPGIQMGAFDQNGTWYAYETADAVEQETFNIQNVPVSDFVYPSWFESFRKPNSTKFDHLQKCSRPFQILAGGYMPIFSNGRWSQIFGSKTNKFTKSFTKKEHPRTSLRSEKKKKFKLSSPKV